MKKVQHSLSHYTMNAMLHLFVVCEILIEQASELFEYLFF